MVRHVFTYDCHSFLPVFCHLLSWVSGIKGGTETGVFENRVLRRIFGPKGYEVTGGWRKLHNEELHNLYSSPSIIRMIT
jgi:hypothetical protein